MAVLVVCGLAENGHIVIIAVEPIEEVSENSSRTLFENLNGQGMVTSKLVISDTLSIDCCHPEFLSLDFLTAVRYISCE